MQGPQNGDHGPDKDGQKPRPLSASLRAELLNESDFLSKIKSLQQDVARLKESAASALATPYVVVKDNGTVRAVPMGTSSSGSGSGAPAGVPGRPSGPASHAAAVALAASVIANRAAQQAQRTQLADAFKTTGREEEHAADAAAESAGGVGNGDGSGSSHAMDPKKGPEGDSTPRQDQHEKHASSANGHSTNGHYANGHSSQLNGHHPNSYANGHHAPAHANGSAGLNGHHPSAFVSGSSTDLRAIAAAMSGSGANGATDAAGANGSGHHHQQPQPQHSGPAASAAQQPAGHAAEANGSRGHHHAAQAPPAQSTAAETPAPTPEKARKPGGKRSKRDPDSPRMNREVAAAAAGAAAAAPKVWEAASRLKVPLALGRPPAYAPTMPAPAPAPVPVPALASSPTPSLLVVPAIKLSPALQLEVAEAAAAAPAPVRVPVGVGVGVGSGSAAMAAVMASASQAAATATVIRAAAAPAPKPVAPPAVPAPVAMPIVWSSPGSSGGRGGGGGSGGGSSSGAGPTYNGKSGNGTGGGSSGGNGAGSGSSTGNGSSGGTAAKPPPMRYTVRYSSGAAQVNPIAKIQQQQQEAASAAAASAAIAAASASAVAAATAGATSAAAARPEVVEVMRPRMASPVSYVVPASAAPPAPALPPPPPPAAASGTASAQPPAAPEPEEEVVEESNPISNVIASAAAASAAAATRRQQEEQQQLGQQQQQSGRVAAAGQTTMTGATAAAIAASTAGLTRGSASAPPRPATDKKKRKGKADEAMDDEDDDAVGEGELRATGFPSNLTSGSNAYTLLDVPLPPLPMPKGWATWKGDPAMSSSGGPSPAAPASTPGATLPGAGSGPGGKARKPRDLVFVTAEAAPWSKTGGLGDVMGALPVALAARGHRVMVVLPRYYHETTAKRYAGLKDTGVRTTLDLGPVGGGHEVGFFHQHLHGVDWVFVDHISYHREGSPYGNAAGTYRDNLFRFALLAMAACEAPLLLHIGGHRSGAPPGLPYGQGVTFIANDWHAGLVPVYVASRYRRFNVYKDARCVLALHNMAHQGAHPPAAFDGLGVPADWYGAMEWVDNAGGPAGAEGRKTINVMKAALVTSDKLVTVSQAYAWEVVEGGQGMGLGGLIKQRMADLAGIVNGIDTSEWDPRTDPYIPRNYHAGSLGSKVLCKLALQEELGLPVDPSAPLLGFIGRLDYQKGPDLVLSALPQLVAVGCQVVMLGSGAPDYEAALKAAEEAYPQAVRGWVGFSVPLSHKMLAACDMLLMPSRFEPCGLNQMYAMRYGTVPIVHSTGGLRDTVDDVNPWALPGLSSRNRWEEDGDDDGGSGYGYGGMYDGDDYGPMPGGHGESGEEEEGGGAAAGGGDIGCGWTFAPASKEAMMDALSTALNVYEGHPEQWRRIQLAGMAKDFSWARAAAQYEAVFDEVNAAVTYCK